MFSEEYSVDISFFIATVSDSVTSCFYCPYQWLRQFSLTNETVLNEPVK